MCFPFSLVDLTEKNTFSFPTTTWHDYSALTLFLFFILLYSRLFWPKNKNKKLSLCINHFRGNFYALTGMFLAIFPCSASMSRFTCHATRRLVGTMKYKNHCLVPSLVREKTDVFSKFSTKHPTFKQVSQLFMIFQSNWAYRITQRQIRGE